MDIKTNKIKTILSMLDKIQSNMDIKTYII